MAGALVCVLVLPPSASVIHAVDAPLTSAVDAPITSAVDAPITSAVDAPLTSAVDSPVTSAVDTPALTTDPIHYFGFQGKEGYSSEEPSDDDFMKKCQCQSIKDWHLKEAQRDPIGQQSQQTSPWHSWEFLEAQKKCRVYCSGLEHYVLERWSSALQGLQATQSMQRSAVVPSMLIKDQLIGPRVPSMRLSMDPLKAGHGLVLPSGEKSTLSLSTTVLSATMLRVTVLSKTILSKTVLSTIALLPHSSLVLLMFSILPALMQGHLFDIHSPLLVPHIFPTRVLTVLWVLLAIIHGLVIIACTLLAIICCLSITCVLVNIACILVVAPLLLTVPCVLLLMTGILGLHHDQPEPENAMLEDQAPEVQTPGTESNETAEASPVNLDPPIFVGDWFCIKFSGVTGDVNIREVFKHLSEDHFFSVRVWKNKGGKGLACLKKKVMLAFTSQLQQDAMLSCFRNSPGSRLFDFKEATEIAVVHQESIASF
ncbi:hypothetical protein BS47DRAFT_1357628 [Hydnum rufescens UP504]|uniref:Uncharacterized protein n=1 Tax=Hydnum rufescens UP504 TaxID=1448309 RepID=A0A9P6E1U5_9AGAM|nr:hypothetical protein BS47DRAFT_1357628 [Hydnum rufescens UP504]